MSRYVGFNEQGQEVCLGYDVTPLGSGYFFTVVETDDSGEEKTIVNEGIIKPITLAECRKLCGKFGMKSPSSIATDLRTISVLKRKI